MRLFTYVVQLPLNGSEERIVISAEEKPVHILHWTTKELDSYFCGEFGWKKISTFGVCSLQYINKTRVRMLVRAINQESADAIVKSFVWHLDAKKHNKKPYARRTSSTKLLAAGNNIATTKSMLLAG